MFKAVCANCGRPCEVPFKPSGDRPVYCKECFRARSEGNIPQQRGATTPQSPRPPMSSQGGAKQGGSLTAELGAINAKLDRLLALLEKGDVRSSKAVRPAKKKASFKKPSRKK